LQSSVFLFYVVTCHFCLLAVSIMAKISASNLSRNTSRNYKSNNTNVLTRNPSQTGGGIRCLRGVSIPCWPVKPAVSPVPLSWMPSYMQTKSVCRSNYLYEKCQTTYGSMKVCNYELDHCNCHRTCEKPISNETVEFPVPSTCLSVVYPDSKSDCM
jgi:hypothetical protein